MDCSLVIDWCATVQGITLPSVCVMLGHIKKNIKCIFFFFPLESWENVVAVNTKQSPIVPGLFQ